MIYIGFSRPKKFLIGAKLIQIWMKKPYSHTYVRFFNSIFHAAHGKVHFLDYRDFLKNNEIIKEYKIETNSTKEIINYCKKLNGIEYGYIELLKIIINDIFYNFKSKIWFPNSRGYICSELVGQICIRYLNKKFEKPLHLITPADIENIL